MVQEIDKNNYKIAYLLPCAAISGGAAVVLQHLNRLKRRGYRTYLVVRDGDLDVSWFRGNKVEVVGMNYFGKNFKNADLLVATHWSTAKIVAESDAKRKIYFVQSDERRFVMSEENLNKVEETYRLKVEYMTEAKWIQRWLKDEFNHDAYYVPNGLDKNIFFKDIPLERKKDKLRILIEGPINSHFKGMGDAYKAVEGLGAELWIVSSGGKPPEEWHYNKFLSNVSMEEMKGVYSACDIFLKMSRVEGFFGPPMEAMSCGCAVVVGKCTGYDEYIVNGLNALVVDKGDIAGAHSAVECLITDVKLRKNLIKHGYETASEWDWEKSIDLLEVMISGDKAKRFYTAAKPEIYDYKQEMVNVRYQMTIVEYATKYYKDEFKELTENFFFKPFWFGLRATRKIIRVYRGIFGTSPKRK